MKCRACLTAAVKGCFRTRRALASFSFFLGDSSLQMVSFQKAYNMEEKKWKTKKLPLSWAVTADFPVLKDAISKLKDFEIPFEVHVMSAHRTPAAAAEFSRTAKEKGLASSLPRQAKPPIWQEYWLPTLRFR